MMKREYLFDIARENKKIILIATSGYNNVGQEAILYQTVKTIKKINKNIKIVSTSYQPEISKKITKDPYFLRPYSIIFLYHLFTSKTILIAGDEFTSSRLDTYYGGLFDYFQGKMKLFFSLISVLLKKKLVFYSIGVYSFQKNFPKKLFKFSIEHAKNVSVRDKKSKEVLQTLGIKKNIDIVKDPGYNLEIIKLKRTKQKEKKIGFVLLDPQDESLEKKIISLVETISKKGNSISFFIFSKHPNNSLENDLVFIKRVISKSKNLGKYNLIIEENPVLMKSNLFLMDFVITMRLHAAIFCSSLGVPFKVISVHEKTKHHFNYKNILLDVDCMNGSFKY